MLIYEKDNKLNINFENSVDGEPDLQIGKDGDKTEVLIDGQPGGGGSNAPLICTNTNGTLDKTMGEIQTAFLNGNQILVKLTPIKYCTVISFDVVRENSLHRNIGGFVCSGDVYEVDEEVSSIRAVVYRVNEATEEAALSAYPTLQD